MTTLSSSGARLMSPRFNPLKKPLMTMRPAAMRKNHQGVDMVVYAVRDRVRLTTLYLVYADVAR